ncbi:MAG TPA: calcium-binding protein [Allocoleopsis sp.]
MDTLSTLTSNRASITLPFVLLGTDGNDTLVGSVPGSTISGLGGNDDLQGIGAGNVISGGAGNDTLIGGDGAGNVLSGDAGNDYLRAGNGGGNVLSGGNGNDTVIGGSGDDVLAGGFGKDKLTGGAGADAFVFNSAATGVGVDTITDFNVLEDKIRVSASGFDLSVPQDRATRQLLLTNQLVLPAEYFRLGSSAVTSSDRLIYDSTNGALFFDADGVGAAAQVKIAQLSAGLSLTHESFIVTV